VRAALEVAVVLEVFVTVLLTVAFLLFWLRGALVCEPVLVPLMSVFLPAVGVLFFCTGLRVVLLRAGFVAVRGCTAFLGAVLLAAPVTLRPPR
jgi:hypothetical protein